MHPQIFQQRCFDVYLVHFEQETGRERSELYEPEVIGSDWIIPSLDISGAGDETLVLNVTTNSTLNTNTFYRATLFTAMDMMEAGSILFCKCTMT